MKRNPFVVFLFLICAALSFFACNNGLSDSGTYIVFSSSARAANKEDLKNIKFIGEPIIDDSSENQQQNWEEIESLRESRTINKEWDSWEKLKAEKIEVEAGEYWFYLSGEIDGVTYTGETTQTIVANKTNTVSFKLTGESVEDPEPGEIDEPGQIDEKKTTVQLSFVPFEDGLPDFTNIVFTELKKEALADFVETVQNTEEKTNYDDYVSYLSEQGISKTYNSYEELKNDTIELSAGDWVFYVVATAEDVVYAGNTEVTIKDGIKNEIIMGLSLVTKPGEVDDPGKDDEPSDEPGEVEDPPEEQNEPVEDEPVALEFSVQLQTAPIGGKEYEFTKTEITDANGAIIGITLTVPDEFNSPYLWILNGSMAQQSTANYLTIKFEDYDSFNVDGNNQVSCLVTYYDESKVLQVGQLTANIVITRNAKY